MITIIGARGSIRNVEVFVQQLLDFSQNEHMVIQALDATVVYGKDHLMSATDHAVRAFERKTNSTNSLALEILLYAAGERQIQKAIKKIGVKKGRQQIAFVITDRVNKQKKSSFDESVIHRLLARFHLTKDDTILEGDRLTLKRFGITDRELSTLPESKYGELILEKVALVDVIK
jgi:KEOPS complex subunit Cgi121